MHVQFLRGSCRCHLPDWGRSPCKERGDYGTEQRMIIQPLNQFGWVEMGLLGSLL